MNIEFIEAIHDIEKEKGVSSDVLFEAIEQALLSAYKKNFGTSQNARIHIDRASGVFAVLSRKEVSEEITDENSQISLQAAQKIDPIYKLGDIVEFEVTPRNFGRIAAQTAKQVVVQRIREAERGIIYEEYLNKENDILTGKIQRIEAGNVFIDLGKTEAVLAQSEQVAGESYSQNERIKAYVLEVKNTPKGPQILLSRTHPGLLKRLFELEVPEIHDGVVEIKSIAREAGARSKISVHSNDENVDPVGACVGPKGMRVQSIVDELNGEKIDIVKFSSDPAKYVANALSPAKVFKVEINEADKVAKVLVPDYQLSLAIGKEGQNARLAAKLTNWKIDIKSQDLAPTDEEVEVKNDEEIIDEYLDNELGEK